MTGRAARRGSTGCRLPPLALIAALYVACDGSPASGPAPCRPSQCGEHARCEGETCICQPGYRRDGQVCTDIDECAVDNAGCSPMRGCMNLPGSFSCGTCPDGYSLDATNACVDIDECMRGSCDRTVACSNEAGGFACTTCSGLHWGTGLGAGSCIVKAATVAAGGYHNCALLVDGAVKCWGTNLAGELGVGDTRPRGRTYSDLGDALSEVPLGSGAEPLAIAAGGSHTCVLLETGAVKCWGANDSAQLGLGDTDARGDSKGELGDALPNVDLGANARAIAISTGSSHSCALLEAGTLKCWGANEHGQLGLGDTRTRGASAGEMGDALPAIALGTGRSAVAVAAGGTNTCALLDDASVKCWGSNEAGQLGLGDTQNRGDTPQSVPSALPALALGSGRRATAVAVSHASHACALLDDGALKCWGLNIYGELGLGDATARGGAPAQMGDDLPAVQLGSGRQALSIALGGGQSCAILDDGSAKCWGYNEYANLGTEDFENRGDDPSEMNDALPALSLGKDMHVASFAPGTTNHSCAVLQTGAVKCWGSNGMGQLGSGDLQSRGGKPGEMGDNLPAVNLGHAR